MCAVQNNVLYLQRKLKDMATENEPIIEKLLTEDENELIEAIRNYHRAYPNGNVRLKRYARDIFDLLMSIYYR